MKKVRVGVIGTGRIGKVHLNNLATRVRNVEVVAAADPMIEDSREWLEDLGITNIYKDYKKVVEDPSIDAIFVCSSTDTHSQISYESVQQGKHVFCEKPIDYDLERIKMVIDLVEKADVKFQVGFNKRFDRNFKKIYEAVQSGTIGAPYIIKLTSRDPGLPPISYIKVSGGIFVDMMIHDFDMMRYLSGEEVVEVFASGSVLIDPAVGEAGDVDTAIVQLRFKSGALGVIDNSREAVYGYDQRAEVFGSKGCIMSDNETPNLTTLYNADAVVVEKPLYFFLERYNEAYISEAEAFIDCIINDKPVPVTAIDGLKPVLIAKAAKKSFETGVPVKVE